MKVSKAIIPIAGYGTRMLPQTKALPKEMLPVVDKPVVQLIVEAAVSAGIKEVILVVREHERIVKNHFEPLPELEKKLAEAGKKELVKDLRAISNLAKFTYVKARGPYGNGMPILNAASLIKDGPFMMFWADDFFISKVPRAKQLIDTYEKYKKPVISLIPIKAAGTAKYGVPKIAKELDKDVFEISALIEKPGPKKAASAYGSVGGYLLTPDIIPVLKESEVYHTKHGGEVYLSEAIGVLAKKTTVLGKVIQGRYHDTGNKEGYAKAVIDVALSDPKLGPGLRRYVKGLLKK